MICRVVRGYLEFIWRFRRFSTVLFLYGCFLGVSVMLAGVFAYKNGVFLDLALLQLLVLCALGSGVILWYWRLSDLFELDEIKRDYN